jgi:hypothetical protein
VTCPTKLHCGRCPANGTFLGFDSQATLPNRPDGRVTNREMLVNRATSLYLDLVRPAAAFVVLLPHVSFQGISGGRLRILGSVGVQAVDVFFVLSGFVIAHVRATRECDVRSYVVSRAARIYSVAIPALILTAVVDSIGLRESPATYHGPSQAFSPGPAYPLRNVSGRAIERPSLPG